VPDDPSELVLIVDDDDATREAFSLLLSIEGFRVVTAVDGVEALEVLRAGEETPAAIVLDLMMPRMDGAQLVRRLAEDHRLGPVPVLICTASSRSGRALFPNNGVVAGLLEKPIDPSQLVAAVRRVISDQ